jgi:ATP-dependent 26S proteasome regulatory subunit
VRASDAIVPEYDDLRISHTGILLYGPPGTGKSELVKRLCDNLGVTMTYDHLAAGDFEKGLVGGTAQMLNQLGERAKLVR